jgi:FkbM family methyltransferase
MYNRRGLFLRSSLRILQWRLISALGRGSVHRLPGLPFLMYLEPRFRSVGSLSLYAIGALYEPGLALLPKLLRGGDVVFDCGANQGVYALYSATLVGAQGRVVAVEPQPYAVAALRRSLDANRYENLVVFEAAVSDRPGLLPFYFRPEAVAASLVDDGSSECRQVEVRSIDSMMQSEGLSRLDLIKLDVEGAEAAAVKGALESIRVHHPLVMFECWDPDSENTREAWGSLADAGYGFFDMVADQQVVRLKEPTRSHGLLAVAPERMDRLAGLAGSTEPDRPPLRRDLTSTA